MIFKRNCKVRNAIAEVQQLSSRCCFRKSFPEKYITLTACCGNAEASGTLWAASGWIAASCRIENKSSNCECAQAVFSDHHFMVTLYPFLYLSFSTLYQHVTNVKVWTLQGWNTPYHIFSSKVPKSTSQRDEENCQGPQLGGMQSLCSRLTCFSIC